VSLIASKIKTHCADQRDTTSSLSQSDRAGSSVCSEVRELCHSIPFFRLVRKNWLHAPRRALAGHDFNIFRWHPLSRLSELRAAYSVAHFSKSWVFEMVGFDARLNQARTGKGILFCGAGFTADCLNFDVPEEIGTGAQLLTVLNAELKALGAQHGFKDIKNAADQYEREKGDLGLMTLLCNRFNLQKVSADMVEILSFPWERIYTTNYDNGIELALQSAGKQATPLNNLDGPDQLSAELAVVHLHGYIKKWDIHNFRQSCILSAESYYRLEGVRQWLDTFRVDVDRAELVAFVGFNAADFHLNEVLFDVSGLREKIYFINRPASEPDPDIRMTQDRLGQPKYIGRQGFAKSIRLALAEEIPQEPSLASFRRYEATIPSNNVPSVPDIEDLFIFGRINLSHLSRDIFTARSDYHVNRLLIKTTIDNIDAGARIVLIVGEICDGKTIILEGASNRLSVSRPVYVLHHTYDDVLDEVSRILHSHSNAVLVIENCFDWRQDRLVGLARMFNGSNGVLLLSSRNIAAEAEAAAMQRLNAFDCFREIHIQKMEKAETDALIALVDQIAGWRELGVTSKSDKVRFVNDKCSGSLPAFLLRLLKSEYVKTRYQEEYNKSYGLTKNERTAIIAALYIAHIGHDTPVIFLSNALHFDFGATLDRLGGRNDALKLVRRRGRYVQTVPAIGATNILEHMIPDQEIIDCLVSILEHLAQNTQHDDFEHYMFKQMMRYSILRSVVSDATQINHFFDRTSKIERLRGRVLFWLQWHMAKTDMKDFPEAEKLLGQGRLEAEGFEKRTGETYNYKQLDDQRAKFLMLRAQHVERQPDELFRDLKETYDIVGRLLSNDDLTHHPFETLQLVSETFAAQSHKLHDTLPSIVRKAIVSVQKRAEIRLSHVPKGYQLSMATRALNASQKLVPK
jgi:hypothetical protein